MARRGGIRVIAGSARGLVLSGPPGGGTRPTASRLRESLFAMLESAGCDFSRVLDLYAGTGAPGIEALSRGAGHCTFVEGDGRACEVVRRNLSLADRGGGPALSACGCIQPPRGKSPLTPLFEKGGTGPEPGFRDCNLSATLPKSSDLRMKLWIRKTLRDRSDYGHRTFQSSTEHMDRRCGGRRCDVAAGMHGGRYCAANAFAYENSPVKKQNEKNDATPPPSAAAM